MNAEGRIWKAEVGMRKWECGSRSSEGGIWKAEGGMRKSENDGVKLGSWESKKAEVGVRKVEEKG